MDFGCSLVCCNFCWLLPFAELGSASVQKRSVVDVNRATSDQPAEEPKEDRRQRRISQSKEIAGKRGLFSPSCEMSSADGSGSSAAIDKRDFDANRPLLTQRDDDGGGRRSRSSQEEDDGSLLSDVVGEIVERDRKLMGREVVRVLSFTWGVLSAYVMTLPCGIVSPLRRRNTTC